MIDSEILTWIFLGGGLFLVLLETFIPGGVSFFLGLSGVFVGILRYLGLVLNPGLSIAIWLASSVALVLAFRPLLKKYWGGDSSFKLADEDFEAMDQIVNVTEPVNDIDDSGRIHYQGISWKARSEEGTIPADTKAKIKYRDNLTWVIESVDDIDEPIKMKSR
jgi:membrane protein implicated in regulation of membrane protease activity